MRIPIRIRPTRIRMRILIRLRVHTTKELPTRRHSITPSIAWHSRDHWIAILLCHTLRSRAQLYTVICGENSEECRRGEKVQFVERAFCYFSLSFGSLKVYSSLVLDTAATSACTPASVISFAILKKAVLLEFLFAPSSYFCTLAFHHKHPEVPWFPHDSTDIQPFLYVIRWVFRLE